MIVEEKVQIKVNSMTYDYWTEKGYKIPSHVDSKGRTKSFKRGSYIEVLVKDLPKNSNVKVTAICEKCESVRSVIYGQYSALCICCTLAQFKKENHYNYDDKNPYGGKDRVYHAHLMKNYGIGYDEYLQRLEAQEYSCAICRKHQSQEGRRLTQDHHHGTGRPRGLLCNKCNTALGLFGDSVASLKKAVRYLENYKGEAA